MKLMEAEWQAKQRARAALNFNLQPAPKKNEKAKKKRNDQPHKSMPKKVGRLHQHNNGETPLRNHSSHKLARRERVKVQQLEWCCQDDNPRLQRRSSLFVLISWIRQAPFNQEVVFWIDDCLYLLRSRPSLAPQLWIEPIKRNKQQLQEQGERRNRHHDSQKPSCCWNSFSPIV